MTTTERAYVITEYDDERCEVEILRTDIDQWLDTYWCWAEIERGETPMRIHTFRRRRSDVYVRVEITDDESEAT